MSVTSEKNKLLSDLIAQSLNGDQVAYAKFLQEVTIFLRPILKKKIVSSDVEDVLQEVLISIHKARHTYDGKRDILPWIIAIMRFRVMDYLRKYYAQMRHQISEIEDFENILVDVTESTSENEIIDDLLADVDQKNKEILTMMYVEGYTAKEVGSKINMSESAVKVAAHRMIKKIRNKFSK